MPRRGYCLWDTDKRLLGHSLFMVDSLTVDVKTFLGAINDAAF